ncbi:mucin-19-like isoform X1 [Camponotus floridanus]|uniref:mucin-19-like isoform X1 n=1 Tax=Camponotus floridanus TaxID=104421 RepID=UPI000DC6A4C3|nr:mucin-19-like isoform X1 [Camponotus floridanus]
MMTTIETPVASPLSHTSCLTRAKSNERSCSVVECPKKRTSPIREILCYTSALDAQLLADSICSCTTLVHQHHDIRDLSISDIADLQKSLKEMHPPLQFIISIHDPEMTLRNSTIVRQEAVARIMSVINEVDGVEMNVTAGSKERLYNFIKNLKDEMIRKSYDKRIFLTLPIKAEDLAKQFDMKELVKYVDLFTLPTDYMTDEDEAFVTFHPSRLMGLFDMLNTDSLVDLISELGAPKHKIMMTLPANAYRFALKHEAENAPRSQTTEKEPTSIDREQLCEAINDGEWTVERDEDLTAPYAFQNETWIAFEDKISVGIKAKYALLRDLAGLAVRDVENDVKTECEMPLTEEIYRSFTEFKRKSRQAVLNALEEDLHQTQFSYPNKAKTSSFRVVRVVDTEGQIRAVRENTQTEFICRRQGYFVHPKSCNRFYRCVKFNQAIEDYSVFEFDCPAGLSFDERTEVCVWPGSLPQGSPCPGSSEIAPVTPKRFECSQPGYYADPQNCRWFFACMDLGESQLMAFEFRCPYDLVFDEKKLVCEWPWLVPACSGSGSAYTRTEYYGGHTAAGSSTGGATGGYITGGLPEYSVTGHSNIDYSKAGTGVQGVSYFTGSTGKHASGADAVSGYVGSPGAIGIDYSKPGYRGTVPSIPTYTGPSIYFDSISPAGKSSTGYSTSGSKISSTGSTGYRVDGGYSGGYTAPSGGVTTGFSGSTAGGYSGTAGGSHLTGGGAIYSDKPEPSYSAAGGYTASSGYSGGYTASGGITAGSTAEGYSGTAGGSHLTGGGAIYSDKPEPSYSAAGGYTASSGYSGGYTASGGITAGSTAEGYSGTAGGSHLTGGGTIYSGRPSYSAAGEYTGSVDASKPIVVTYPKTGYFASTESPGSSVNIRVDSGPKYVGSTGSSGSIDVDYSKPGYGGTVSSIPTYTGPSSIYFDSISPAGKSSTGYSASGSKISSTGSTGSRIDGGYSGGYTAPLRRVTTGFSGSTAGGYSGTAGGSHLTGGGAIYSGRPESSYSATGGYTGSVDASKPIVVTYPKTGYFASTESPGSPVNIGVDSTGPKYVGSTNLYTSSGAFNADGYSASPGIYSGVSRQPSFDKTGSAFGIGSSYPGAIDGQSTAKIYEGSIGTGYSKATSGILQGSTSSDRASSATHFGSDASKSITSGISAASGHTDATITDSRYFGSGSVPSSGVAGASPTRYGEEGYTVPVFLLHGEPTYPLIRPTGAEIKNHTGIPGVIRDYAKPDLVRPNLNISIFGNEIPTSYDIPKGGTIVTGSGVQGSIFTDSTSGTVFRPGNIPGATSSPVIHEGTILTGGVQPGYIASATPQPGYVITDDLKTANIGSASPGTLIYGSPTPAISVPGPSSGVDLKGDITPGIVISGQTAPGVSIGSAAQPGIETSTIKSYVSQAGTTYHGGAATRGCSSYPGEGLTPTRPQGYKPDGGCGINTAYDTGKYSESDVPDYRPTSATLPDSIVPGGRIEGISNVIFGPTSQGSTTAAPGYSSPTSAVFTPSGFTKTGLTRTGITTAILGGGGSYSVSTSERRPAYPENISEKAFEGAGYTKISSSSNAADLSVTSTPPGYFSTASPSRITQRVQSATSGYSYPKPNVQLGTSGITFTPSSSIENNLPITSPKPFSSINVDDGSGGINVAFGSKIPTVPADRRLSTSTVSPVIYTTKRPEIYKTTLFEAAKVPVSTFRPIIDTGYRTVTAPLNNPFLAGQFVQQTGSSQAASTSNIDLGSSFQQTDFSSKKDYGSSLVSEEYLPAKASTKPGVIASTTRYEVPEVTVRPDNVGITYKEPSSFAYKGPSSITSPTTFRPSNVYYTGQGFSSSTETTSSGSPTNLDISRDKIDKLITNYNRGTVKYMSNVYDTTAISGFGSTAKKFSSPGSTTSSYEVATKSLEDKGKVIVKWSDLHPLLLGKLGAECTCKADPFATLRGPVRKLIASSKGKVDLANYDSSEIYVDLENSSSSEEVSSSEEEVYDGFPAQPYKISPHETSTNQPSSSYLPVASTTVSTRDFVPKGFRTESFTGNAPFGVNLGFRTGRKLKDVDSSPNSIAEDDLEEDPDQIINGATDCARPGLFRHPSLCNKFYACHWDQWKKKFTLHIFNCPIHLTFDSKASACNWPSKGPACQADNLLV